MTQEPLNIADRGSFLLVEFFGKFSVEAGRQCIDRMVEASVKHGRPKVLLDCRRMTGVMQVLDRFEVAEYGAATCYQLHQVALLGNKDMVLPDKFVENVAVNRGMNLKIFTDFDEAVLWLSQSTPNKADAREGP